MRARLCTPVCARVHTPWRVGSADPDRRDVRQQLDELVGGEARRPLVVGVLVQPEPVVLLHGARRRVALREDRRRDLAAVTLDDDVDDGGARAVAAGPQLEAERLVVGEPLLAQVAVWARHAHAVRARTGGTRTQRARARTSRVLATH